jgi:hypothetical protein
MDWGRVGSGWFSFLHANLELWKKQKLDKPPDFRFYAQDGGWRAVFSRVLGDAGNTIIRGKGLKCAKTGVWGGSDEAQKLVRQDKFWSTDTSNGQLGRVGLLIGGEPIASRRFYAIWTGESCCPMVAQTSLHSCKRLESSCPAAVVHAAGQRFGKWCIVKERTAAPQGTAAQSW